MPNEYYNNQQPSEGSLSAPPPQYYQQAYQLAYPLAYQQLQSNQAKEAASNEDEMVSWVKQVKTERLQLLINIVRRVTMYILVLGVSVLFSGALMMVWGAVAPGTKISGTGTVLGLFGLFLRVLVSRPACEELWSLKDVR